MTTFTYDENIPNPSHNPSSDVTTMQSNSQAIGGISQVDHVGFNAADGGTHKQVNFTSKNAAGAQTDPSSMLYTGNGTASSIADLFFRNQNGIFRPNIIKAAAVLSTRVGSGPVTIDMGYNVDSVVNDINQSLNYTINLTNNAVIGTNVIVIVTESVGSASRWSFATNTLSINATNLAGFKVSFVILQV